MIPQINAAWLLADWFERWLYILGGGAIALILVIALLAVMSGDSSRSDGDSAPR